MSKPGRPGAAGKPKKKGPSVGTGGHNRRALEGKENGQVLSGRNGDVPAEFRAYVEEYYRSISRPKPR